MCWRLPATWPLGGSRLPPQPRSVFRCYRCVGGSGFCWSGLPVPPAYMAALLAPWFTETNRTEASRLQSLPCVLRTGTPAGCASPRVMPHQHRSTASQARPNSSMPVGCASPGVMPHQHRFTHNKHTVQRAGGRLEHDEITSHHTNPWHSCQKQAARGVATPLRYAWLVG